MTPAELRALAQTVRAQGYHLSPIIAEALRDTADKIEALVKRLEE